MKVSVVSKGNPISEGLREYFSNRANFALGRYLLHIHSLRASLEDTSNPRDGLVQSCRVEIAGEFGKRFIVVHDRNFKSAIDCALSVSNRVVERALNRADSEMFAIESNQKLAS
jgi:ribosome-associated translation inhibitor RaiA